MQAAGQGSGQTCPGTIPKARMSAKHSRTAALRTCHRLDAPVRIRYAANSLQQGSSASHPVCWHRCKQGVTTQTQPLSFPKQSTEAIAAILAPPGPQRHLLVASSSHQRPTVTAAALATLVSLAGMPATVHPPSRAHAPADTAHSTGTHRYTEQHTLHRLLANATVAWEQALRQAGTQLTHHSSTSAYR